MEARTFQINDLYEPALTYEVRCLAQFFNIMINERCVKEYCHDDLSLIENYELAINDYTQTWDCHHRGEILPCGRFSIGDLKKFGLYYKRPASELIFLTKAEHNRLHKRGVLLSEENKQAISDGLKGHSVSEATKKAIGESNSKKIMQFTKSGEFIREWPSLSEVSRQLKINCGNICSCCNGKYKSAGGFIWRYA